MSKNTVPKKSTNIKPSSAKIDKEYASLSAPKTVQKSPQVTPTLKRRCIHDDPKSPDERNIDEDTGSESDSPQKKQKLYPAIPGIELLKQKTKQFKENIKSKTIHSKATSQQKQNFGNLSKYIFFLIMIVLSIIASSSYLFKETPSKMMLEDVISSMESHFKNQNYLTFRVLKKGLEKVVNDPKPSSPAIFTIVPNKNAKPTATEFSLYLAKSLASNKYILINNSMYWHDKPDDIKLKIDEEIKSNINESRPNVIVVDNLQKIPYEAAMIFHSYCDHLLAPFKQAVFLFIVPSLDTVLSEDATVKIIDRNGMKQLRNVWSQASDDVIDSLITRITVNVINIR